MVRSAFSQSFCWFQLILFTFCFSILVDVLINAPHLHILQIWKITWFFFVFNKTSFSFRFFYSSYEFQNETSWSEEKTRYLAFHLMHFKTTHFQGFPSISGNFSFTARIFWRAKKIYIYNLVATTRQRWPKKKPTKYGKLIWKFVRCSVRPHFICMRADRTDFSIDRKKRTAEFFSLLLLFSLALRSIQIHF